MNIIWTFSSFFLPIVIVEFVILSTKKNFIKFRLFQIREVNSYFWIV